jgi:hypothetical protein
MTNEKLNRLKEVLKIQSKSKQEERMIAYLANIFEEKGYEYSIDKWGNVYVTKGSTEWFPCFVAHTDTVHEINDNMIVIETKDEHTGTILTGMDSEDGKPSGIGGDDKCGVFLALEMLDTLDNVKAAFFVSEEIGCLGSKQADRDFFADVGYAIQYDSPEGDSMSYTLMGDTLFGEDTEFGEKVGNLILEHGIDKWERHPFTDIWPLMEKFNFSCLNLAAGYYRMHTASEYVIVEDVQNAFELGIKIVESLGEERHNRPNAIVKKHGGGYHTYSGNAGTPKLLVEHKRKQKEKFYGDLEFSDVVDGEEMSLFDESNLLYLEDIPQEELNKGIQTCYWWDRSSRDEYDDYYDWF